MYDSCCSKRVLQSFPVRLVLIIALLILGFSFPVWAACDPTAVMLTLPESKQLADVSDQLRSDDPLTVNHHTRISTYARRWQGATSFRSLSITVTIYPTVKAASDKVKSYGAGLLKNNDGQQVSLGDLGYRTNHDPRRPYFMVHKGRFVVSYYTSYPGRKGRLIDIPTEEATIRGILGKIGNLPCFAGNTPPPPPPSNNCPTGAKLSISPAQPLPTDTITFTGQATDADGDQLTYRWYLSDFNRNNIPVNWGGSRNTWQPPGPGRYEVYFEAGDGKCSANSGVSSFSVVADPNRPNNPPVIQLTAKPNPAQIGQEVVYTATVNDPDGDPLGGGEWYGWKLMIMNAPTSKRVGNTFVRKEKYSAAGKGAMKFVVKDVMGKSSSKSIQVIVTDPTQPLTVKIRCDHPVNSICRVTEGGQVVFTAVANNPKQDPLTYKWSIDGIPNRSWQGPQAVWTNIPASFQYKLTVQVWKQNGETATDDIYLEVDPVQPPPPPVNNTPKVQLLCLTTNPQAGKTVDFRAKISDPDGDKLTWRWSLDGQTVGWSGLSPAWSNAIAGTHKVTITVSDGTDVVSDTKTFSVQAAVQPPPPPRQTNIIQSAAVVDNANGSVWGGNPKSKWQVGEEIGLQIDIKPVSRPHNLQIVWLDAMGTVQKRETVSLSTNIAGGQGQTIYSFFQSNLNDASGIWTIELAVDGLLEKTLSFSLNQQRKFGLPGSATGRGKGRRKGRGTTQPTSNWESVF